MTRLKYLAFALGLFLCSSAVADPAQGPDANGTAPGAPFLPVTVAGSDGTNIHALKTATDGSLIISSTGGGPAVSQGTGSSSNPWYFELLDAGGTNKLVIDSSGRITTLISGSVAVSASSLPLPTGASTAAKQPALGTAGAASADVLTIQGIASMTKLLVTPDALPANQTVNTNQIAGTATSVNNGTTDAGTQRVVVCPNTDSTALSSAARTTTTTSSSFSNYNCRTATAYLNVTAASGTGGLQVRFLAVDPASGNTFPLGAAPTAITATGQYAYEIGPGCTSTGGAVSGTSAWAMPLPRTFQVQVVAGDSSSYTYSVGLSQGS